MQFLRTQSTGNITLHWADLSQCCVRVVRKCRQSPANSKCYLEHLVAFLRHSATFKYITVWIYHRFQGTYSVPETLVCILFNTLQQPVFFSSEVAEIPNHAKKIFLGPCVMQENWFIESGSYVLSEFEVSTWVICTLLLLAVISVCLLISVPIRLKDQWVQRLCLINFYISRK